MVCKEGIKTVFFKYVSYNTCTSTLYTSIEQYVLTCATCRIITLHDVKGFRINIAWNKGVEDVSVI